MASGDLTTLANVKQWVNVSGTGDDGLLTRLITSVSNFIQTWLNRTMASVAYTETYDGSGGVRQMTVNFPVTAVSSVTVDGSAIPQSTGVTVPGYTFDLYGLVMRGSYRFARGQQNVVISYTAGYATLPVEIEQAAIELVSLRYAERRRPGVSSQNIGGETVTYREVGMTDSISALLIQYKKVVPV